jgi:hypothetical protein
MMGCANVKYAMANRWDAQSGIKITKERKSKLKREKKSIAPFPVAFCICVEASSSRNYEMDIAG